MADPEQRISRAPKHDTLLSQLGDDPVQALTKSFSSADPTTRSLVEVGADDAEGVEAPLERRVAEAALSAARKIEEEGADANLTPEEEVGIEAIVLLTGRPPILIQNGSFFPPPQEWQFLEQFRQAIETSFRSVGRVEVTGHPSLDWIGTGFLVAPDVIMTNRHVAVEFSRPGAGGSWSFAMGMTPRIDYVEELGGGNVAEFTFTDVIGIHDVFDLALLRVEQESGNGVTAPEPLTIASEEPAGPNRKVYVVGYPAWDGRRNDPIEMQRIFTNIFNVKRLQPGEIIGMPAGQGIFNHDCSTLGGNSGSCVIDILTNQVVGLHFGGRYLEANRAVALWELANDPLLQSAGVNFG